MNCENCLGCVFTFKCVTVKVSEGSSCYLAWVCDNCDEPSKNITEVIEHGKSKQKKGNKEYKRTLAFARKTVKFSTEKEPSMEWGIA